MTPDWALLERVATGHASAAERDAVERWIGGDPARRAMLDSVRRIVDGVRTIGARDAGEPVFDTPASLARAQQRLGLPPVAPPSPGRPLDHPMPPSDPPGRRSGGLTRRAPWHAARVAAGLITGIALGVTLGSLRRHAVPTTHVYATNRGERATVLIEDGTHIVLAPASRLTATTSDARRDVVLEGEAFFDVVHDPARPFAVHAGNTVATDVGTSFDVRAYTGDRVDVAVVSGRVSVATGAQTIALGWGDVGTVEPSGAATVARGDVQAMGEWTAGKLAFHATRASDATRALARWYDIDLALGDSSLARLPLTASFRDEPVAEVLHIVAAALGARIERYGRTVRLVPRHHL